MEDIKTNRRAIMKGRKFQIKKKQKHKKANVAQANGRDTTSESKQSCHQHIAPLTN